MLEPWIIEQIRRREEEERKRNDRPRLEIPPPAEPWQHPMGEQERDDEDTPSRGVTIIDFRV